MAARIIVADDSATIQKAVEFTFARHDVELIQAHSGEEAMRKAQDAKPALMLIDHSMPDQSGSELCGALRKNAQLKDIPIILMAGVSKPVDEAAARQIGANDVVIKPFDSETLIGKVKQLLAGGAAPAPVPEAAPAPAPQEEAVAATEPAASEDFGAPMSRDMIEEMMSQQPPTQDAFDLTGPAAAEVEPAQDTTVPTYDLSTAEAETPSLEKTMEEVTKPTPAQEAAAPAGIETFATEAVTAKAPAPTPHQAGATDVGASAGSLNVPPEMIDKLAREVAGRVATHIVQELKSDLLDRVERILWEVVPELGEQLITQEIKRIRELVEGKK